MIRVFPSLSFFRQTQNNKAKRKESRKERSACRELYHQQYKSELSEGSEGSEGSDQVLHRQTRKVKTLYYLMDPNVT